ncbi:MAG TPA: hypothetical protein VGH42_01460 [Verrucomicrobiae bacterium]|jgi:hypothetical protein
MSEFKFACPVCGQHMKCDVSQSGSVMECPTCFQKITAPQAPATDDPKFIITGTKVGERPAPTFTGAGSDFIPAAKGFPGALVVVIILIFIGAAVAFVYRGTIFKSVSGQSSAKTKSSSKPAPVAPPASDANWTLSLDSLTNFPDATAAGRIHGQDFIVERAILQNGTLTLREGKSGPVTLGVQINFGGAQPEALAGQSLNIATNAPMAARITMRWQDGGEDAKETLEGGYAMRLDFSQLAGNRLSGKIYLCTPDDLKSYVAGTFNVEIRKPKPPKPK